MSTSHQGDLAERDAEREFEERSRSRLGRAKKGAFKFTAARGDVLRDYEKTHAWLGGKR